MSLLAPQRTQRATPLPLNRPGRKPRPCAPQARGSREVSNADLVHKSITACPIDLRRAMCEGTLLVGCGSLVPGLAERLKRDLEQLAPNVNIDVSAFENRDLAAWAGCSMLSSLVDFESNWALIYSASLSICRKSVKIDALHIVALHYGSHTPVPHSSLVSLCGTLALLGYQLGNSNGVVGLKARSGPAGCARGAARRRLERMLSFQPRHLRYHQESRGP